MKLDFDKGGGLLPTIVQDADTLQVLMLGYMNSDAVERTRETGFVTFYSRSRQTLWTKGETSGNRLKLVKLIPDCDNDTLLVTARPLGPTCHQGTVSCFGDGGATGVGFLAQLAQVIASRQDADPETSYTARLLAKPIHKVAQKVGEEGVETALAATSEDDVALMGEASDLLYHLLVLLEKRGVALSDVMDVLAARHA